MPREIRWFVQASLLSLVLSCVLGTLMFAWPVLFGAPPPPWVRPMHLHLGTVGWLVNMVFGVALWMFPLPWGATSAARYSPPVVRTAWLAINGGLVLRFAGEMSFHVAAQIASGVLQTTGVLLCVGTLWKRIRASGGEGAMR